MTKFDKEQERYTASIYDAIANVLEEEMEAHDGVDFINFMTAYVKAGAVLLMETSQIEKNFFEFTHFMNQLIVQDMLSDKNKYNTIDVNLGGEKI